MIRITAPTTTKGRDLNRTTTAEIVLNGYVVAFSVLAVGPIESKAERTVQYKHNTTIVTGNSSLFNLISKSSAADMLILSIQ